MEELISSTEVGMPLDLPAEDKLAKFRAQVAAEKAEPRGKTAEVALARHQLN